MTWLLRLYPRPWRRRYGAEIATLLAAEPRSLRLLLDLVAGAIDARLNPQWLPTSSPDGGQKTMSAILRSCRSHGFSSDDVKRSAVWMIASSLGFVLLGIGIQRTFGQSPVSLALLCAAYPMALILSSRHTYLKPYPRAVRSIILIAAVAAMFGFFLLVSLLAESF